MRRSRRSDNGRKRREGMSSSSLLPAWLLLLCLLGSARAEEEAKPLAMPTATTTSFAATFDAMAALAAAAIQNATAAPPAPANASSAARATAAQPPPSRRRCATRLSFVSTNAGPDALPACPAPPPGAAGASVEPRYQNLRQEESLPQGSSSSSSSNGAAAPPEWVSPCLALAPPGCPAAAAPFLADLAIVGASGGGCRALPVPQQQGGGGGLTGWEPAGALWPGQGALQLCARRTRDAARALSDVRVGFARDKRSIGISGQPQQQPPRWGWPTYDQDRRDACPRGYRPALGGVRSGGGQGGRSASGALEAFLCLQDAPSAAPPPPPGSLAPESGGIIRPFGASFAPAPLKGSAALVSLPPNAPLLLAAHSDGGAEVGGGGCLSLPTGGAKGASATQRLALLGDGMRVVAAATCGPFSGGAGGGGNGGGSGNGNDEPYAHQHWTLERLSAPVPAQDVKSAPPPVWRVRSSLTGGCLTGAGDALLVTQQPCGRTAAGAPLPWQLWALDFVAPPQGPSYWALRSLAPSVLARGVAAARATGGAGSGAPQLVLPAAAVAAAFSSSSSQSQLCASVYHDVDDYYELEDPGEQQDRESRLDLGAAPVAFAPALVLRPCAPARDARQRLSVLAAPPPSPLSSLAAMLLAGGGKFSVSKPVPPPAAPPPAGAAPKAPPSRPPPPPPTPTGPAPPKGPASSHPSAAPGPKKAPSDTEELEDALAGLINMGVSLFNKTGKAAAGGAGGGGGGGGGNRTTTRATRPSPAPRPPRRDRNSSSSGSSTGSGRDGRGGHDRGDRNRGSSRAPVAAAAAAVAGANVPAGGSVSGGRAPVQAQQQQQQQQPPPARNAAPAVAAGLALPGTEASGGASSGSSSSSSSPGKRSSSSGRHQQQQQ